MCYVYLIQEPKLLGTNRLKVGYSSLNNFDRLKVYDVLTNCNVGLDKYKTEEEMIKLAIVNKNFIITKAGKDAQWYLKGNEKNIKNILYFKNKLKNDGKKRNGLYSILIEKIIN